MRRKPVLFAVLPLVALAIAGCGSSSSTNTKATAPPASTSGSTSTANASPAPGAVASIAAQVPTAIKSKGTITVAADASYAPNEFFASDGKTVIGMDADLVKALGAVMGIKVSVVNATFDSIIPGLAAGKFDMGASSFTDTKAREKTVDFVTYFTAGESFYTKSSGGVSVSSIADICGYTISVEKGTTEGADAMAQGAKCTKAGKKGVTVQTYPDQNGANLAVSSGRAQLGFADTPVAYYQVKQTSGEFKVVGASYANAPYGLAFPKGSGLVKPTLAALKQLMSDGTYTTILTKWGVQSGAITNPVMNGATS
jgi:polar amino acid transport system substrate-binding protein